MEERITTCPYCGQQINNNDEKCSNCGEFFVEPNLSEFKLISIPLFLACESTMCACGLPFFYSMIWLILNRNNIRNIANQKDLKKFNVLLFWFVLFVLLTAALKIYFMLEYTVSISSAITVLFGFVGFKILVFADFILEILLSYRILRIIEKFTLQKYNSPITHHEVGMWLFRTLYVVYYLDTYLIRVKDPKLRYCLNTDQYFKYFLILAGIIFLIYFLGLLSVPMLKV